ncbi:MAG: helix-turn-helix transcriptional regulator [Anaerolineae bacterium]|nr:helix-turn-helix transcriptional regulator [Anaerolineae bacterium]
MSVEDSRWERRKREVRERLMEAAWQLFSDRGYEETTVAEIAEAADVAKGTFFNYFPTKESIAEQIMLWRIDLLRERVLGAPDAPQSALARIKLLMAAMGDEFAPKQGLARMGFMARIGAPVPRQEAVADEPQVRRRILVRFGAPAHRHSVHHMGSVIHELVVQAQAQGEIRADVEPGLVARLLMTSWLYHFSKWEHEEADFPGEESVMHAIDVLIEGLDGRTGRSR